jgi:hypothetical protein
MSSDNLVVSTGWTWCIRIGEAGTTLMAHSGNEPYATEEAAREAGQAALAKILSEKRRWKGEH